MSKIECKVQSCLNNRYNSCMKARIDVSRNDLVDASCETYKEKMFKDYKSEFAYQDFPMSFEVDVDCTSHECTYNRNLKCYIREIEIKPTFEEGKMSTICKTYHAK